MKQFFSLLSWRLFTAQHVSGVFPPIIRSSKNAVAASGFTFVSWWQSCCVRGRAGQRDYHHDTKVKPEAGTAVIELLMMGGKTPETCWAVNKRQDNKLKKLLHQVGDLFELNVKLRCQKVKQSTRIQVRSKVFISQNTTSIIDVYFI